MPLDLGLVIGKTGPVGATGPTGATGTALTILGIYGTKEELIAEHPTGSTGDTYLIDGHYFLWDTRSSEWTDLGPYRGPDGYSPALDLRDDGHLIATYPMDSNVQQFIDMVVPGVTKQNLWVNPSGTKNGVTVKSNADGSITLEGTATSDVYIYIASYLLKTGSEYTLSVDKGTAGRGFYVQARTGSGSIGPVTYVGGTEGQALSTNFTFASGAEFAYLGFGVSTGTTVSGTYRVMLNEGDTAESWCPPGINGAEPTSIVTAGKNLWENPSGTSNGVTVTSNADGSITLSGAATTDTYIYVASYLLKPGSTYTLSVDNSTTGRGFYIQQRDGSGAIGYPVYVGGTSGAALSYSFTLVSNATFVYLGFGVNSGTTVSGTYHVMLNEGEAAEPWEPSIVTETSIDMQGNVLYSLPDGTRDELRIDGDGKMTKVGNIGVVTFDGSDDESWTLSTADNGHGIANFRISTKGAISGANAVNYCDTLPLDNALQADATSAGVNVSSSTIYLRLKSTVASSVDELRNWLAAYPTTVVFKTTNIGVETKLDSAIDFDYLPSPGTNAWVVSDIPTDVQLNFTERVYQFDLGSIIGPTGDTGPIGPTGPKGDTGDTPFVSYISTSDIDSVIADDNPQGSQVQDLTGLSYFWSKLKSWATGAFAAIKHTHQATDVSGLTTDRALVSNTSGQPAVSPVTSTELGYLDGASSNIQEQINTLSTTLGTALLQVKDSNLINNIDYCVQHTFILIVNGYYVSPPFGQQQMFLAINCGAGTSCYQLAFGYNDHVLKGRKYEGSSWSAWA